MTEPQMAGFFLTSVAIIVLMLTAMVISLAKQRKKLVRKNLDMRDALFRARSYVIKIVPDIPKRGYRNRAGVYESESEAGRIIAAAEEALKP